MVGSQHPQPVGEQVAVLGGGLGGLPGRAQQVGEVGAGGEGVRGGRVPAPAGSRRAGRGTGRRPGRAARPRPATGPGWRGREGVGVVGSQHPQEVVEQVAVLGGGLGGLPGPAQHVGEVAAGGEGLGVVGSQHPQEVVEQVAEWAAAWAGCPASPSQEARLARVVRVLGWSGPRSSCAMSRARSSSGRAVSSWPASWRLVAAVLSSWTVAPGAAWRCRAWAVASSTCGSRRAAGMAGGRGQRLALRRLMAAVQ